MVQLVCPLCERLTGTSFTLLLGVFAHHRIAEELIWHGCAYRRLREGRTFRRAVLPTMPLTAATHIPILVQPGPAAMVVARCTRASTRSRSWRLLAAMSALVPLVVLATRRTPRAPAAPRSAG